MLNPQAVPPDLGVVIDHKSQATYYSYLSSELQGQVKMPWIDQKLHNYCSTAKVKHIIR